MMEAQTQEQRCDFFLLRYVPDAVKDEFVNVGLVLLPQAGGAELRFTRDWARVRCLDPDADVELLQAVEAEFLAAFRQRDGDRNSFLRKIQESFSNSLQLTESKACLVQSPATEADALAELYLDRASRRQPREISARQAILGRMRREFESAGVWRVMRKDIPAADYTRPGDPLKIDCGYSASITETVAGGPVKMFHALALPGDVNAAKLLAFTFPQLAEGIRKKESQPAHLTAIVEDDIPRDEEQISFALETLAQRQIMVAPLAQMASIAATAARDLAIG